MSNYQGKSGPVFGFRDAQHKREYVRTMEEIIEVLARECGLRAEFPMMDTNFERDDMVVVGNLIKGCQRLEVRGRGNFWAVQGCGRIEGIQTLLRADDEYVKEVRSAILMAFDIEAEKPTYEPHTLVGPSISEIKKWDKFIPESEHNQPNV